MIPNPTKKRLLQLHLLLTQLKDSFITSVEIENIMGWKDTSVRKDISYVLKNETVTSTSNGYNRIELQCAIEKTLELASQNHAEKKCCIVGLGKIAQGIIQTKDFEKSGFVLSVGFDSSINRVETFNAPFPLYTMNKLEHVIAKNNITFAILDVPDECASEIGKRLSACGITGIVNYTHTILPVPHTTKVKNVSVIAVLTELGIKDN